MDGWGPPSVPIAAPDTSAGWGPPSVEPQEAPKTSEPVDTSGPMPGPLDALTAGIRRSIGEAGQSAEVLKGKVAPTPIPQAEGPETEGFGWRDLYEPSRGLSKLAYQTGASSPTLAGGVLGGLAGSAVSPGLGTAIGGAGGAAAGTALQTIGPSFASELKRTPEDPHGAWDRAVEQSIASGAFSGASWAAFPIKFFKGPLKNLAFQAFGIQPGISVAEQATKNIIDNQDVTKGLQEAYTSGAVTTAVPALGHLALRGHFGEPEVTSTEPTPQQIAQSVADKQAQAQQLLQQAQQPGVSPTEAARLTARGNALNEAANIEADRHAAQQRAPQKLAQADQLEQQAQNPALNPIQQRNLLDQAKGLREEAREDSFIGNLPPPLEKPQGGLFGRMKESYFNNIDPEFRSEAALKAGSIIAKYKSMKAQAEDSIVKRGEDTFGKKWKWVPWNDQLRFYSAAEGGQPIPHDLITKYPWMDDAKDAYRTQLDLAAYMEGQAGSKAAFIEDYLPHAYKDVQRAQQFFKSDNIIGSMGADWFQKSRTYDALEMGISNGLEPRFKNVQDFINLRLMAGADMINKMEMLHDLQSTGVAVPLEKAPPQVLNPGLVGSPFGWNQVKAPTGEKWLIAPDATALWKNGVEAKGLWANETGVGDAFRTWMKLKNAWVPIKLGLSLFHPVHVAHISMVNNMSRALKETFGSGQQGLARRAVAIPEAMLQSVGDTFFALPIGTPFKGKELKAAWLTPKEDQTPAQRAYVQMMNEAGISAQLSEQLRDRGKRAFAEAIAENKYLKALPAGATDVLRGLSKSTAWIFDKWIPNLKMAALARESEALLRRRPDLVNDPATRGVAMRALGKQIDNRFGEMFYGSLFWNRTLKDASIGSFLSLGWNLGFAREFGGGFFEPIVRRMIDAPNPTRALVRQTTNKTTNMFIYSMTAMAINAVMNKSFTGEDAQGLDYIFPRIGGLNPDGSPRRITNAFYTREVPMAFKNIEERQSVTSGLSQMLYHKMLFSPFVEMGENKDYFGNQIYDENSPFFKQAWQFGKHLIGDQLNPMSISGARRALQLSGKPYGPMDILKQINDRDVMMPILGFGPAPAYASKSPLENRIMYLFRRYVAPEAKSFETGAKSVEKSEARTAYIGAIQRNDETAKLAAARKLAELGVATKEINKLQPGGSVQYMFQRLPAPDQKALLKQMSKAEFKEFFPKSQKKLRGDPEVSALAHKYYSP
jgi:hypothetical protein